MIFRVAQKPFIFGIFRGWGREVDPLRRRKKGLSELDFFLSRQFLLLQSTCFYNLSVLFIINASRNATNVSIYRTEEVFKLQI